VALFFDAGKVAPQRDQLDLKNLATDVGVGVRFHTPSATPLRVELAHSDEIGWKLVFAGTAAF
jgi:outer membrane translocation and assembly module TamA